MKEVVGRASAGVALFLLSLGGEVYAQSGAASVEEIVVRARKRDELLQDVPVSVATLSEVQLEASGLVDVSQMSGMIPNLQLDMSGAQSSQARVSIRGIGNVDVEALTADPGAPIYVDGIYLARSHGSLLDLVDIEQVEVLRGPQGTLFGRNSAGGAVNIRTIKPTKEVEGRIFLRPGDRDRVDTKATLNIPIDIGPLEDRLYSRFTFSSSNDDGYTRNTLRGEQFSNRNRLGFLGSLRLLATDDITIDISGSWAQSHQRQRGGQCRLTQDFVPGVDPNPLQTLMDAFPDANGRTFREACRYSVDTGPFKFETDLESVAYNTSYGSWGSVDWDLGDVPVLGDVMLRSITGWREQVEQARRDMDQTGVDFGTTGTDGDGEPFEGEQVSQEIQLVGEALDDTVRYVVGGYYFNERVRRVNMITFIPIIEQGNMLETLETHNWNFAFFSQVSWDVFDWLSVTGGLRWTEEKKGVSLQTEAEPRRIDAPGQRAIFTDWSPMASVLLRTPDHMLPDFADYANAYFTYAQGFKSGGFNARSADPDGPNPATELETFAPEDIDSFEIGLKSSWLDRRLTANVALFHADYDDQQVLTVLSRGCEDEPSPPCVPTTFPATTNAASSTVRGAEIELTATPLEALTLTGSLGILDARYDEFIGVNDLDGSSEIDRSGESFDRVPDLSAFVSAQYDYDLEEVPEWASGTVSPRLEWAYQSDIHLWGPELRSARQRGYGLLHGRISYLFLGDRAQVALWSRNLTDERYLDDAINIGPIGYSMVYFAEPRTWGGEISYRF